MRNEKVENRNAGIKLVMERPRQISNKSLVYVKDIIHLSPLNSVTKIPLILMSED